MREALHDEQTGYFKCTRSLRRSYGNGLDHMSNSGQPIGYKRGDCPDTQKLSNKDVGREGRQNKLKSRYCLAAWGPFSLLSVVYSKLFGDVVYSPTNYRSEGRVFRSKMRREEVKVIENEIVSVCKCQ